MKYKRTDGVANEAYRSAAQSRLDACFSKHDYQISEFNSTVTQATVQTTDCGSPNTQGAWVAVRVWIPRSIIREPLATLHRVHFNIVENHVDIMATGIDDAILKFNSGQFNPLNVEDGSSLIEHVTLKD